jgi:hypothetical protein
VAKLFCILTLWASCAVAQTVEGSVLNSVSGQGIAGVTVDIARAGVRGYSTTTDTQGHFVVEGVKDGSYTVRYRSPDYWPSDPDGSPLPPPAITEKANQIQVTAGRPVKLEAHMVPLPTLSGRVVDGRGKGVRGARVRPVGPGLPVGDVTDAEGKFSVHEDLLPGAYTLSVAPPLGIELPEPEPDSGRVLSWTRTYYAGASVPEAASKIVLRPGEVRLIELKLLAVPAHPIRGVLLKPDGAPAPEIDVTLAEGLRGQPAFSVESKPDGTFEFPAVPDGEWRLSAEAEGDLQAGEWIEMTGHEIVGIKLRLTPPFTVHGKTLMESAPGIAAPEPPSVYLSPHVSRIAMENWMFGDPRESRPDRDGGFSIEGVYPGLYSVNATEPRGYYLDVIREGEAEVTTRQEVSISGPVSITLFYKTNGGTVRGAVEKCAGGRVMLIPHGTSASAYSAMCDSNDRYEITAVRPGEYHVLAIPGNSPTPWFVLTLTDSLLKRATSVTVNPGETSTIDLRAVMQ